jgi:MFS transporter, DHA3 family, macrolide efflux protein
MGAMVGYGSWILSPAFAGVLYPVIGLLGITVIDLSTFAIAIATMLVVKIPKTRIPKPHIDPEKMSQEPSVESLWQKMTFGFRYLNAQPSLWTVVIAMSSFAFLNQVGETLYQPMILAQTGGNAQILGTVVAASGIGGVTGALVLSFWGGFRRRVLGMLIGFIGTGLSKLIMGIGQLPVIWATAQFWASLHSPLISSSYTAM